MHIEPAARIRGELVPPPDKSISHRAALLGAMSGSPTRIRNYLRSADTAATIAAVAELGAIVDEHEPGARGADLLIRGVGLRGAREAGGTIDVGNAGTLLRILPGWLAGQGSGRWTIDGDESIRRRPVDRVAEPLRAMGAVIECREGRLPPLLVQGSRLEGIRYELPVASAQVKSCLLLAGLLADGRTSIVEPLASRDHTELMLREAGAPVAVERDTAAGPATVTVAGVDRIELEQAVVPGDFSSAAFFIAAAALVPSSELTLREVGVNPTRTGLLRVMARMGVAVEVADERTATGEAVADLTIRHAELTGTTVAADEVPFLIDELPLVALLGACAAGTTRVRGAEELRHKESDRIATVVEGLGALGATIEATPDGFLVQGREAVEGGVIDAHGDHRLAMLGAVAGLVSRAGVEVKGFEVAAVSYPGFLHDLERVAGSRE
jgi:3-phosphoshikimate 1-carboxyvinyltransferase